MKGSEEKIIACVAFTPDGGTMAFGGSTLDETLHLWDLRKGKPIATKTGHADSVRTVISSHDGSLFAAACEDGVVSLWESKTGEARAAFGQLPRITWGRLAVAFLPGTRSCCRLPRTARYGGGI